MLHTCINTYTHIKSVYTVLKRLKAPIKRFSQFIIDFIKANTKSVLKALHGVKAFSPGIIAISGITTTKKQGIHAKTQV